MVLDNLREGVIAPDWYEPRLECRCMPRCWRTMASWPIRVACAIRIGRGTVESSIQYTQGALNGRTFDALDAQNTWLADWEERWASRRIHGRKKRQVAELFAEERAHLLRLPLEGFRSFTQGVRTVDDAGLVQIEGAYYAAGVAALASVVTVRVYAHTIEILDRTHGAVLRHAKRRCAKEPS